MRLRVLVIIACILPSLLVLSQSQPLQPDAANNTDNPDSFKIEFVRLENLGDSSSSDIQESYIQLFKSIPYSNIIQYAPEINSIYNRVSEHANRDSSFYLETLRIKSLLTYQQRDYTQAIEDFNMFFKLFQLLYKNDTSYAFEYSKYAICYRMLNQKDLFLSTINKGISNSQKKVFKYNDLAIFYIELGAFYSSERRLDTARITLDLAIDYVNSANTRDYYLTSQSYRRKAFLELLSNNTEIAITLYEKSMDALLKSEHTNIEIATLYKNKATALLSSDQFVEAIKQYKMALHIYRNEFGEKHPSLASIYRYLGLCYLHLGDNENAILNYKESLEIDPSFKNFLSIRNLADVYFQVDENAKADSLYKISLNYLLKTKGKDDYQTNMTYLSYGQFLIEKNIDTEKGEDYLKQCINFRYKHYQGRNIDICHPLNILGAYYLEQNQITRGIDSLQSSLICAIKDFNDLDFYNNPSKDQIFNNRNLINTLAWKAYGMYLLYLQSHDLRDLKTAHKTYKLYFHSTKNIRKYFDEAESVFRGEEIYYVFNQAIDAAYQLYLETNDQKIIEDIFSFIEGKKAFTLLNSLNVLEQKKLLKIPKNLLNTELDLKYQMGIVAEQINIQENSPDRDNSILIDLDKQAFELSTSLDSIQNIYKNEYSGFYQLKYGFKELTLEEIQNKIPEGTAFINYSMSDTLLNIMCISKGATELRHLKIDSAFYAQIQTMVKLLKNVDTDNSYNEFIEFIGSSRALYKKLIQPIEDQIINKELIIIPDGILNYLSFDALLTHDVKLDRPDYRLLPYMIKQNKSNIANSMQVYFNMKIRSRDLKEKVFAFAPSYSDPLKEDSLPSEYQFLRPLDYAELETQAIKRYLPTLSFIGEDATEENFFREAKNAGVLHLAMHTILDDQNPMYSKLLFTYNNKTHTGLINTFELLTMDLNAELAVLSGCSTGEGELQQGEGVMSLSSGFQYAGVPAIVMSLWEVNDRFGALVVDKFYYYLSEGMSKNKALHLAKTEVLAQGNALYAHPYYWAGLVLMGENEKLQFLERKKTDIYLIVISGLLLMIILGFTYKRKWKA